MLQRSRKRRFGNELIQEKIAPRPRVTDPARNPGQPRFNGASDGIRKQDRNVEICLGFLTRPEKQSRRGSIVITSSTSGIRRQKSANFDRVSTVNRTSGLPRFSRRIAGALITASPSQLLDRTRIRNGARRPLFFGT